MNAAGEVRSEPGADPDGNPSWPDGAAGLQRRILEGLRGLSTVFSRNVTAAAFAEHGTREMALDQLEAEPHEVVGAAAGSGAPGTDEPAVRRAG